MRRAISPFSAGRHIGTGATLPPHNLARITPRTLTDVLGDIEDACRDATNADLDCQLAEFGSKAEDEASDRMSEAEDRTDELRDEFAAMFQAATGLTWKQIENAIEMGWL
jgi:hypothetical protein